MSLKKRLIKNGLATGLQKLIRVAEQLLLVPFFISAWGVSYYGEWLTLTTVPSLLAFADLGFGSAAANSLVLLYASNDTTGASKASKTGLLLLTYAVIGCITISGLILFGMSYGGVFSKILIPFEDALITICFLMLSRIISFYQQLFEGYYRASRRASLSINLQSGYSFIKLSISLIILLAGYGIVALALADLVITILFNILYISVARKLLPLFKNETEEISRHELLTMAKKGMGYLMSPVWQAIFFQGSTLVVRITLGAGAVALFNTLRTVCRSVNQFFSIINGTVFPDLQYEIGAGRFDRARQVFRIAISVSLLASIIGTVVLGLFGSDLYESWTNKALHPPLFMWYAFLTGIIFNSLWWTACVVFRATNKPGGFAVMGTIAAIVSVAVSFLLSKLYGITGAAVGSLALEIIMSLYVIPTTCRILNQSLRQLPYDIIDDFMFLSKNARKSLKLSTWRHN